MVGAGAEQTFVLNGFNRHRTIPLARPPRATMPRAIDKQAGDAPGHRHHSRNANPLPFSMVSPNALTDQPLPVGRLGGAKYPTPPHHRRLG